MARITRLENLSLAQCPILSGLATGYSNEKFISNRLMPEIPVAKDTGKYPIFPADALEIHENYERPFKSDKIKEVPITEYTYGTYTLQEYALGATMDRDEIEAAADILSLDTYWMNVVVEKMALGQEKARVDMLVNSSNYASGHSSALSNTSCWSNAASSPITAIKNAAITIKTDIGVLPNILVLGPESLVCLQEHAQLTEKIKYSQKAIVTEDLISDMISTSANKIEVVVGSGIYKDPSTGDMTELWGDVAILAYVPQAKADMRSMYTPSFGYTFTKKGYPYGAQKSGDWAVTKTVAAFMKYQMAIVQNTAGYLFTNTKA